MLARLESFANLVGKTVRIGSGAQGFAGEDAGGLMITMAVAVFALETGDDDVGAEGADHSNEIGESDIVAAPFLKGLVGGLGEAEVGNAAEALFDAVVFVGGEHLERAKNASSSPKALPVLF